MPYMLKSSKIGSRAGFQNQWKKKNYKKKGSDEIIINVHMLVKDLSAQKDL